VVVEAAPKPGGSGGGDLTADEATALATDAYVFGFPLVLMGATKDQMTSTAAGTGMHAPVNQLVHMRAVPTAAFRDVVSPNADTLYSSAFIDVSAEPIVLSLPAMPDRYHLFPILDAWSDVIASPGTRTTGNGGGAFALVGPRWSGELPAGLTEVRTPTNLNWMIGRIVTSGPDDYAAVNALQDQVTLTPLSAWGTSYQPPEPQPADPGAGQAAAPIDQVTGMDGLQFFAKLDQLLRANPMAPADAAMAAKLERLGIGRGLAFDGQRLDDSVRRGMTNAVPIAKQRIAAAVQSLPHARVVDGWQILYGTGSYGTEYLFRAAIALAGFGANLSADALYPITTVDATGHPLTGAHRYVLHFERDQLPPVNAFWSVTMYDAEHFFIANPIDRYAIGDRSNLRYNADGSLDLYIQAASPGADLEANWLPAPRGPFNLIMRLYWPQQPALDQSWSPPGVRRAE
jgi:hypothetical protein